ncbi:Ig-like domain-containing protein [Pseudomonas cerasi]
MAQLNDGRVDILSRDDGSILSQANAGSTKNVLLNQPSVVKVHGTREMVAQYERQGNDLILHMKDGTTVHYQQFFLDDVDGDHSELVFDDGVNPPEHALFPVTSEFVDAQTAMVLTPQYESLGSLDPLLLADTGAGPGLVTAAGLGALGLVGLGAAALGGGGGGGGGDGGNNGGGTNPPATTPTLTIGTFAGDNVLSAAEKETTQLLSGTTTNVQAGQAVVIVLNGVTYNATVQADGSWSVAVPASALEAIANGSATISASVTNSAGQTVTGTQNITVEGAPTENIPQIAIGIFAGNDVLEGAEKLISQTVSGSTVNVQQGQVVTVTLNGKTYSGAVDANGEWSVSVPTADLTALTTGAATLSASVSNTGGISASATHGFNVLASTAPSVSITSPVSEDGYLNAGEAAGTLTLTGTASGVPVGTTVSVTLGGRSYSGTTLADGSWTVTVPSVDLQQLPQGQNLIVATIVQANGTLIENSNTVTVDVITLAPVVQLDLPFIDGVLSGQEIGQTQTVTGRTGVTGPNQTVSVDFNNQTYTGTVDNEGRWSVTIPAGAVGAGVEGTLPLVVNVTDPAGNTGSSTILVTIATAPPVLSNIQYDDSLNAVDITQPLTVTGNSAGGQSVTVSLGGQVYTTTVSLDGSWRVNIPASALQQLGQNDGNTLVITSSDKYGNTSSETTLPLNVDTQAPTNVTLTAVTDNGDNVVSPDELANLTIKGTAESGSTIRVFIGEQELSLTTIANGNNEWSIVVSDADKAALADGSYPIRVVASDAAGNETTVFGNLTLAVQPASQPSIQVDIFAGDNALQGAELSVDQTLSGKVMNVEAGQPLTVIFNGVSYATTVLAGGLWHVTIPAAALQNLPDGSSLQYTVNASNAAGVAAQQASGSIDVVINPSAVTLAIAPIAEDNWINATEAQSPVVVSGSSLGVVQGTQLTVTFNEKSYTATVDENGNWSTLIPPADFVGIANNYYDVKVEVAGDPLISATLNIGVQASFPDNVTVNAAFGGDNILNLTESKTPQTLSGNTGLTLPDQIVTVELNGKTYTATVNTATGAWSINLPTADLQALTQGDNTLTVTVRDAAGNVIVHNAAVSVDTLAPDLSVGPVAVDGVVNRTEQGQPLPLSGTAEAGSTIIVTLNGVTYRTGADAEGNWSVNIAASTLQTLADGKYDISVTARDSGGNETLTLTPVTIDTASPPVTVAPVSGDGYLNALEHSAALEITGTTEPGASVVVSINNVNYTATVNADGSWSATVPADVVSGLVDGSYAVTATATDSVGNSGSSSQPLTVIAASSSLPIITVGAFAGDNVLDGAEKELSQLVTGTTSHVQAGQIVTVSLNGSQYTGLVLSDGSWSVRVPAAALHSLANGTDNYTVDVSDVAGNPASANGSFTVDNTFSAIAIGVISDDNMLNASEALQTLVIHGFSRFVASGSRVAVTFNNKQYLTTTNSDGSWAVDVPPGDLTNLPNGNLAVTASTVDVNGNTITVEHALNSEVNPGFLPEINPLFGDGYLNAMEVGSAQILSGSSGVEGAGQTVNVLIGGIIYTGTVDAQGNWSVSVPSATLQNLPQGANTLSVTLGDSAGNSVKVDTGFVVDTVAPVLTLDAVAADNRINLAEQNEIQTISGSGTQGDRISVTLNDQTYTAVVNGTGYWEIDLPVNALKALTSGSHDLTVTSTDDAGNVTTLVRTLDVDITPPSVSVNPVSDGYINAAEAILPLTVTGSGDVGNVIRVELAGTTVTAVVGADGAWSAVIPGNVVAAVTDGDYTLTVTAVDAAGNTTITSTPLTVDTGVPSIIVNSVTSNNSIDGAEQQVDQIITGTASNVEVGQTLTLTLSGNGATYSTTATIQSGGAWQANLPANVLDGLANGSYTLTASVTDKAGNTGITDKTFSVDDTQPAIAVSPVSEDGYLSFDESQAAGGLDVTLTTLNVPADSRVTFSFNNTTYDAVLQSNGTWLVNIPRLAVMALTNGTVTGVATVYDSSDTPLATSNGSLIVHVTNLPQPTLDTPFGDNILSHAEALIGQTLTGTTGEVGDGQNVVVTIGNSEFLATVNSSGVWNLVLTPEQLLDLNPKGAASVLVTVVDVAGNRAEVGPVAINVATVLPSLSVGAISEDGIINATEQQLPLLVEGNTAAGNTVVLTMAGRTYTAVVDGDGHWTATIPALDLGLLDDGGYDLTVTATDPVGNKTVDTEVVIVDTAAPTYTLDPIGGDGVIDRVEASQPLDISGTGTTGDSVSVTLGGTTLTTTVDGDGKWVVTVPVDTLSNLPQGQNTVQVVVTDPEGNNVTQNATVVLATTLTNALLVNPVAGDNVVNAEEAAAGLAITGSVPEGTTTVVVTFNGQPYTATVGSDGLWSAAIPAGALTGLVDNGYTLTVVATPLTGDSVTVTRPIVLDTTPPTLTIAAVSDGYLNASEQGQPLPVSGTGNYGDSVRVTLNGKVYLTSVGSDNSWVVNVPGSDLAGLSSGTNTVSVVVKDPAGNTTSSTKDFIVDTLAPSLTLNPITGDNIINASEQQTGIVINGTGENGATIVVTLNGQDYATTVAVNGLWQVNVNAGDLAGLTGSRYPVSVTETDLAGNKTTQTSTLQINTTQPTISVDLFAGNGIVDGAEQHVGQKLSGTTTNVEEGQLVILTLNGVMYSGVVLASGAWSIDIPVTALERLSNGEQTYIVSVSNSANTSIEQTGSFVVNNLLSGLAINPVSGDGFLSAQEASLPLTISGSSANVSAGTALTISLNGEPLGTPAVVDANGTWSLTLQPGEYTFTNGPLVVTVSGEDAAGEAISSSSILDVHLTNLPVVTINPLFGDDNVLNALEAGSTQTLTGTTGLPGDGQTVIITLAGVTYTGTVDSNGNWSVAIPGTALSALQQNANSLDVLIADAAGNTAELTVPFNVDSLAPAVTVDAVSGDGVLNAAERGSDLAITGTGENGSSIVVTLSGVTYPPVLVSNGSWTVTIPSANLQALPDGSYPVSVTATDAAQNASTPVTSTLVVKADAANLPTITIDAFAGNNIVDGAEQQSDQLLSGKTTHVEQGQTVTVTFGSLIYNPVVQSDGSWSISVPSGTLQDGTPTINAAVSDAAGNPATSSLNITVNTLASGISIDPISDGYLNASEYQQSLIVTGHTANVTVGTPLSLFINGQTFSVNVGAGGVWSVLVPASALAGLSDGKTTVSASTTDANGDSVSGNATLNVMVHNLPRISVDTPFNDGVLNASEAALGQTLHGTSGVAGAGQTVSVLIGATPYTGTVDANGNWVINLPSAALQALPQTGAMLAVTVTDVAGNSSSQTVNVGVDTVAPTVTLNAIATDGVINATEAAQGITISGGSTGAENGQTVSVVFNGHTYATTVDSNGDWNLTISSAALGGVANGNYTLTATVTDAAGNPGSVSSNVTFSTASLQPTINTPFGDGYLNDSEANNPDGQSLTGTTGATGSGQTVVVTVGGLDYTITADTNGNWALPLSSAELQALDDGGLSVSVTVTNGQGNTGSTSISAIVDQTAPALTLDNVASDNVINASEIQQTIPITGSTSVDEAGQTVSITFNGNQPTYTTTVQNDGTWRFDLPGSVTQNLPNGSYTVTATLTDKAGNQTTQTETVEVRAAEGDQPIITIDAITGDDYLNTSEVGQPVQLSGTASVTDGRMVEITFNGQTFYAEVSNGVWSYLIPANAVADIADGPQQVSVSVSDIYGNIGDDTRDFTVIARGADLPSITINPVTSDDVVNYNESRDASGILITGSSQHIPEGDTITVRVNGNDYPASVDAEGNWTATIPQADAQNLPQNSNTISASGNDVAGNTANASETFSVHSEPPLLNINAGLVADGTLSLADALTGLVLQGEATPNLTVDITLGTKVYSVLVDPTGHWTTTIPSADLLALVDGELGLSVSVRDAYGNTTEQILNVDVEVHAVTTLTLLQPFGDGLLSAGDAELQQTISGTVANLPAGASLVVNVGAYTNVPVAVDALNGTWSAIIPAGALVTQGNGVIQVSVETVGAVNPVSATTSAELVLTTTLNPTILTPFGDGLLDVAEAGVNQTLSGTTGVIGEGQTIVLTINGTTYPATVDANGIWTAILSPTQLLALGNSTDHEIKIVVGDAAGNTATASLDFSAIVTELPTVTVDPLSLAGNGILTKDEVAAGITLGGTVTFGGAAADAHVIVNVNGTPVEAIINGDGTWSLPFSGGVLETLPDGTWPISVTVTDGVGNTGQAPGTSLTVAINNVPAPTMTTPFLDGFLNIAESGVDQVLRGSTHLIGAGQAVTVSIDGGTPINATVTVNGSWSLDLSASVLSGLGNGEHTITVVATDAYGNSAQVGAGFEALLTLTLPTITNPFGTGLGIAEAAAAITLTGTTGIPVVSGQDQNVTLKVDVNGMIYNATVVGNTWSVDLPAGALSGLSNTTHQIIITVIDAAGNPASESLDFNAYLTVPQPTIAVPFDNGYLNVDALAGTVLTGTTGAVGLGQTVSITFGNLAAIPATVVNADGSWTLTLSAAESALIAALPADQQTALVTVTDPGGNTNTLSEGFIVDITPPTITSLIFAGDNVLNYVESLNTQTLTGVSSPGDAGATVTLNIGNQTLSGMVGENGTWTINVGLTDLVALVAEGGNYSVSITDVAGNTSSVNGTVGLNLSPTLDSYITLAAVSGDNIINVADGPTTVISGTLNNVPLTVGGQITITVGGELVSTIAVDALRLSNDFASLALVNANLPAGSQQVVVTFTPTTGDPVVANSTVLIDLTVPTVTITQFAGDSVLTVAEAATSQTISGTASDTGSTVTVMLGSKTYTAVVQTGGSWTVNVPSADLQGLAQNVTSISASVKDAAGNTGSATLPIVVDTVAPLLDVDALLGNNVLNLVQTGTAQLLTGHTDAADGQTVSVYLGNSTTALATALVLNGAFSLQLQPSALGTLLTGANVLTVKVSDEHGNQTSAAITVNKVINSLLALNVDTVFGDTGTGYLNAAESTVSQTITGTAISAAGGTVSLTVGNLPAVTATVGADGKWSLLVPTSVLGTLTNDTHSLTLVVTDVAGNVASATAPVSVIVSDLPVVGALTGLFGGDNLINIAEAGLTQTVTGSIVNGVVGSVVTVTLGVKAYTTTVQTGGSWRVSVASSDLLALGTGNVSLGVTVVDPAGNTATGNTTIGVYTAQPAITLNTIFGDGVLSIADVTNFANQLISGTVKNVAANTTVTLNIGNLVQVETTVDASGKFSTPLTQAQILLLTGVPSLTVTASVTDVAGNHVETTSGLQLSLTAPSVTLNQTQLFGDGLLNAADALTTQLISGTTTAGSRVVVTVGNSTTPLVSATADANGLFSLGLTPSLLASLADGALSLKVTVTDAAGNTTSNTLNATVGIHALPSVTLNTLFGDGVLSVSEALSSAGQLLSGHVNNVPTGTQVTINVGSLSLPVVTTDTSGNFGLTLSSAQLLQLATGSLTISASVTDAVGNTASSSAGVTIGVHVQPTLTVNTLFGDGILNAAELATTQTVSGTTTNAVAGSTVTFTLNGTVYSTTVGSNGNWSVSIAKTDLNAVPNGTLTINATLADPYGNTATGTNSASVISHSTPTITFGTLFGDGALNAVEAQSAQTISGTSYNAEGSTILIHVGTQTYSTVVAANGRWSVSVPSVDLKNLPDTTTSITASLTNGAGTSSGTVTVPVIVGTHTTPTVTLGNSAGFSDGYLNLAESGTSQTFSGTSTNAAGGTVKVVFDGSTTSYTATIAANGTWSVTIPSTGLTALADGTHTAAITVTDRAGNVSSTSTGFTAVTHNLPAIGVDPIASLLNVLLTGLTISGGTLRLANNTPVTVTLSQNGKTQSVTTTVGTDGRYNAKFIGGLLSTLDLSAVVTVTALDAAGNPATTVTTLLLGSLLPLATSASLMMAVASDESLAATDTSSVSTSSSSEDSSTTSVHTVAKVASTLVTDSDTSSTDSASSAVASTTASSETAASTTMEDSSYTIGGVTITLADGQTLHGDSATGSAGNDIITLNSLDFTHIDGGAGTDTLVLNGEHLTLDLTSLGLKIEHVEIIDLGSSGNNSIKLDLYEALNITDKQTDDLVIKGMLGDQVTLANTDGGVWATTGQRTVEGQTFDIYHNSALSSDNTLGDVLIQHNLQVHVV